MCYMLSPQLSSPSRVANFLRRQLSQHFSAHSSSRLAPRHPARRWTRTGNKWSMSLTPPSGVGIAVTQVEATDGGKTVFLLGYLLFKAGGGVLLLLVVCGVSTSSYWVNAEPLAYAAPASLGSTVMIWGARL